MWTGQSIIFWVEIRSLDTALSYGGAHRPLSNVLGRLAVTLHGEVGRSRQRKSGLWTSCDRILTRCRNRSPRDDGTCRGRIGKLFTAKSPGSLHQLWSATR